MLRACAFSLFALHFFAPFCKADEPQAGVSTSTQVTTRAAPNTPASIIVPIDLQLRDLRAGNIEAAYKDTTSKEFKETTSLEAFKEFVERYPILAKHKTLEVKPVAIQQNDASVTVVLNPQKEAITLNYLLIRENNLWKVWHVSVTPLYSDATLALLQDHTALRKPIEGFLEALQNQNSAKAYQAFTSEAFRTTTSIDVFRKYINEHPVF